MFVGCFIGLCFGSTHLFFVNVDHNSMAAHLIRSDCDGF